MFIKSLPQENLVHLLFEKKKTGEMKQISGAFGVSDVFSVPIDHSSQGMEVKGGGKPYLFWVKFRFHI